MPFDGKLPAKPGGVADHLMQAKQYLIDRGWCHEGGVGKGPNGEVCVGLAFLRSIWDRRAFRVFADTIGIDVVDIPSWNDALDRTFVQVMDTFDRAIEAALIAETVDAV